MQIMEADPEALPDPNENMSIKPTTMNAQMAKESVAGIKSHILENLERGGRVHHLLSEIEGCLTEAGLLQSIPSEGKAPEPSPQGIPMHLQSQTSQINSMCGRLEKILGAIHILNT